jgi:hypothetical protein
MTQPFAFDPLDANARREPWALYARGRAEFPAWVHAGLPLRVVSIFRHDDVQATLRDDSAYSNSFPTPRQLREVLGDDALPPPSMLGSDGDFGDHHHPGRGPRPFQDLERPARLEPGPRIPGRPRRRARAPAAADP